MRNFVILIQPVKKKKKKKKIKTITTIKYFSKNVCAN